VSPGTPRGHVLSLCGGVGGAKLAFGLTRTLGPEELTLIVNCGDDFEHLGLSISPDIDTVVYTLSGLADQERGWGVRDESWSFMAALGGLGGETWFRLGDRDLAMHVERTRRLRAGQSLSEVTGALCKALGLSHPILPMSDDRVSTLVDTDDGPLTFQEYFVREQCRPRVVALHFEGAAAATPSPGVEKALARADIRAVIICPSNPYLSIDPILAMPALKPGLKQLGAPIVAVSPIIGGAALKGPAAKLMLEFGVRPSVGSIADHYRGWIDGLVIDTVDAGSTDELERSGLHVHVTDVIMNSDADRCRLAAETLNFARRLERECADGDG
jgi:LPPG:FO 2-phospho-L-lactate transferase